MAFNPSNPDPFFGDFREFGTLYTKDQAAAQSRLDDLQAALAYAQTLPDTDPNKAYFIQEAGQAINGQKSDLDYITSGNYLNTGLQADITANQTHLNAAKTMLENHPEWNFQQQKSWLQTNYPEIYSTLDPDFLAHPNNYTSNPSNLMRTKVNAAIPTLQNQFVTTKTEGANTAYNAAKSGLVENFNLTDPNWGAGQRKLEDYYKNQAIPFATEQAKNDIYQSAYNISKGINQRMISSGLGASGLRKKALSDVKGQALGEFGKAVGAAENEAAGNIKAYKDQAAAQERAQRDLERRLQTGTAEDIFSGSNQELVGAYNTNTQAQQQKALQDAQKQLAQQQSSDRMLNDIFGTAFGAAGDIFSGGLI